MVHTPPLNLSGIGGTGDKLDNLTEQQTPEAEKTGIVASTGKTLSRFTQVLGLTGALALGSAPALAEKPLYTYEPTADAGGTMLVIKEGSLQKSLEQRGFSAVFAQEVARLERENREQRTRGELPNEPDYMVSIEPVAPIKDAKGMEVLIVNGSALPKMDEKALGIPDKLDESNYTDMVNKLFDTTDIDTWIRNADGSEMTEKKKAKYRRNLGYDQEEYLQHLDKLKTLPNGAETTALFFSLYNEGKKVLVYPSRESYRRLLVASFAIASYLSATPEKQQALASYAVSRTGEYMLLTDPKTGTIVRIRIGIYDYMAPSSDAIRNHPVLGKLSSLGLLQAAPSAALGEFGENVGKVTKNGKLQVEVAQKEGALAQKEGALAQKEGALAQKEGALAQEKGVLEISSEIQNIASSTTKLIKEYTIHSDMDLKNRIDANMEILRNLQKQIHIYDGVLNKSSQEAIRLTEELTGAVRALHAKFVLKK